jgi:hypothetical protein
MIRYLTEYGLGCAFVLLSVTQLAAFAYLIARGHDLLLVY